jgi:RNA polymerase sigma-70 factor (ECF subfamily)
MTDHDLVTRARAGDRDAFTELIHRYQARLRAGVARYVIGTDDVQDIVQDALIDAWRNLHRYDPAYEFGRWLWGVCRNRMRNFHRHRARHGGGSVALDAIDEAIARRAAADDGVDEERIVIIRHCIERLAEPQRVALDLRYRIGLAVREVAARLGRSEAATAMALSRIRAVLAKCVGRDAPEGG